jgi:hypothetical protein
LTAFCLSCIIANAQAPEDALHYHASNRRKMKLKEVLALNKKQSKEFMLLKKETTIKTDSTIAELGTGNE